MTLTDSFSKLNGNQIFAKLDDIAVTAESAHRLGLRTVFTLLPARDGVFSLHLSIGDTYSIRSASIDAAGKHSILMDHVPAQVEEIWRGNDLGQLNVTVLYLHAKTCRWNDSMLAICTTVRKEIERLTRMLSKPRV